MEKELKKIDQLNYVVLRPAIIYGIGDRVSLTPWLILGAIYRHLGETLQLLWHNVRIFQRCFDYLGWRYIILNFISGSS